jgi:hypothetical protein
MIEIKQLYKILKIELLDFVKFLKELSLPFVLILVFFYPKTLNEILVNAGFEEGSVAGFKWKTKLAESNDNIRDLKNQIEQLDKQNKSLLKAINENQANVKAYDPIWIAKINNTNNILQDSSERILSQAKIFVDNNTELLLKNKSNAAWGVVFSGDKDLISAKYEITVKAQQFNLTNSSIYFKNNSYSGAYRSIAVAKDNEEAKILLERAKLKRPDSYIVNLTTWCSNPKQEKDFINCS